MALSELNVGVSSVKLGPRHKTTCQPARGMTNFHVAISTWAFQNLEFGALIVSNVPAAGGPSGPQAGTPHGCAWITAVSARRLQCRIQYGAGTNRFPDRPLGMVFPSSG